MLITVSDFMAELFEIANPVVLETLWAGGDFGRFHALPFCMPKKQAANHVPFWQVATKSSSRYKTLDD